MEIHYHAPVTIYIIESDAKIHVKLDKIMGQNEDLNLKIDELISAQDEAGTSISNIAADIAGIKEDLEGGLSAEQTLAAMSRLGTAVDKMKATAATLKTLDESTPPKETTTPGNGEGGENGGGGEGTGTGNGENVGTNIPG